MKKSFKGDESAIDAMEAPCKCNCGNWFDLEDGYPEKGSNNVICEECYESQEMDDLYCNECGFFLSDCDCDCFPSDEEE